MRLFLIPFLVICFFSCGTDSAPESSTSTDKVNLDEATSLASKDLITGLLETYPDEIIESGCGCTLNHRDGNEGDLFYVFDWQGNGGGKIRINDNEVVLQRGASLKTGNAKYDSYLHQNDNWTVKTSITNRGPADEGGSNFTGKVKISNRKTGVKTEVPVKGICSC